MKKSKSTNPKISYEPEADILTWELSDKDIYSAKEMGNVIVHFTKHDLPVLIEILDATKFLTQAKRLVQKDPKGAYQTEFIKGLKSSSKEARTKKALTIASL